MLTFLKKYQLLQDKLKAYGKLAVAFSGGVDSTLLSFAACSVLQKSNILVLFAESCLLAQKTIESTSQIARLFPKGIAFVTIQYDPFTTPMVERSADQRCYSCKLSIYSMFKKEMAEHGFSVLADGTNVDDLAERRPGLQAIKELNVEMPLVDAGMTKADIRAAASHLGLPNATLASNSCLATRLDDCLPITHEKLALVDLFETFLTDSGYPGCRVRPRGNSVLLELPRAAMPDCLAEQNLSKIKDYFIKQGFLRIYIDIIGR